MTEQDSTPSPGTPSPEQPSGSPNTGGLPSPAKSLPQWRVLLVDDDEDDYFLTRHLLGQARQGHFELDWAASADQGHTALDAGGYDAALVDHSLGLNRGVEFIRERARQGDGTPMILYTGWGGNDVDLEAMQAGAADFINKSESTPALLERSIRYAIERRRYAAERAQAEQSARAATENLGRSEQRYRGLYDAMTEGFALGEILYDEQGEPASFRLIDVNPGFEANIGFSAEEIVGRPIHELLDHIEPYWLEVFSRVARFGQPLHFTAYLQDLDAWFETFTYRPEAGKFSLFLRDVSARQAAEAELRASEERFRAVLENSLDVAYRRNLQADLYDYMSPVIETMTGYTPAEMSAMPVSEALAHVHPEDLLALEEGLALANQAGSAQLEYRFLSKGGRYIWVADYFTVTYDEEGRPLYRGGIMRDITASKEADAALQASEKRFRMALENLPDVLVLYDRELRIQYINQATREITGMSSEQFIGRRDDEVFPAEIYSRWMPALTAALTGGEVQSVDIEFDDPSGQTRYLSIQCVPVKDAAGQVVEVIGITHDLTARRKADEAMRVSEQRFRTALEHAPISVFNMDRELRYTWVHNPPGGVPADQIIGRRIEDLFPGVDLSDIQATMRDVVEKGRGAHVNYVLNTRLGERSYDLTFEPITGPDGEITGLTAAAFDVTELRRLQREQIEHRTEQEVQRRLMRHREHERAELARLLHDNTLQSVLAANLGIGAALTAEDNADQEGQLRWVQDLLKAQVHELRRVVFELRPPMVSSYGLEKSIRSHLGYLQEWHPEVKIDLMIMGDEKPVPRETRQSLYRIYQELVNNVVRHANARQLEINLEIKPHEISLEVHDDGVGFEPEGDWVERARRGQFGLIGIREQVQAAGGLVDFQSTPGQGSCVAVSIPLPGLAR